jgi:curved DNA-binding protein CbpA
MKRNVLMTKCNKGGIKIKDSKNGYRIDPFDNVNPFNVVQEQKLETKKYDLNSYQELDLNVNNYSRRELYKLFGLLDTTTLNEGIMKECKKIVLKTHPDKSNLDNKYFVFFSEAYKKLLGIYEFQNKTNTKKMDTSEYYETNNAQLLDKMFETDTKMKEPKNFNKWFNDQFEKYRLEDPVDSGYGNWLKSEEDIVFTPTNITKDKMASEMEKRKKHVQTITTYSGVNSMPSHTFGGSSLIAYDDNFTSSSLFSDNGMGFTDLKQAYVESVIPVTEEDYRRIPKFNSLDEYRKHRDNTEITPIGKEEAMRTLYNENKEKDQESAALAFYYAKQSEKVKNNNNQFWTGLKQIHC